MHVGVCFVCKHTFFFFAFHHYMQQYVKQMGNTFLTGKSQFKVLNMARLELHRGLFPQTGIPKS